MSRDSDALRIVEEALAFDDTTARAAFVARACGGDGDLLARVERLLSFEDSGETLMPAGSFLRPLSLIEAIPDRIGPYRVTGEIARGGMGAVVKAERCDGMFEQTVAIKLIRGDIASPRAQARFAEERRILGRLHHPSIVRILDGGEAEGRPWLAMDFVEGLPVDEALDRAGADRTARLEAFVAVCEAVAYAHRQLVVHADVKPSNVLMDGDGRVHLLDFGIARLVAGIDVDETGDPYPLTRGYAAPERGVGVPPTVASDVYSLGVLLLVMLGLGVPPADATMVPGTRLPQGLLDGDLGAIAAHALAEDPAARYPDAAALASDIRRHRGHIPVRARDDAGWRYRAGRFVLRHHQGLALTALAGGLLLATSIGATVQYVRAERARAEADARFADARGVARYLIFDLLPRLEHVPRSLPQRVEAASVAERYLTRLAGARQASDELRGEVAEGLLRLAMLQGRIGRANLGLPGPADRNLRRAEAIAAGLSGDAASLLLARIRIERVRLATWMKADVAEAERLAGAAAQSVAAAAPRDPRLAREFAMVLADLRGWQGDFAGELRLAGQALGQLGGSDAPDDLLDRAGLISLQAEATYYSGKPAEALLLYRRGLAILEELHRRRPDDNYALGRLVLGHWEVGTTLLELKRHDEALQHLSMAERLAGGALAFEPADHTARRRLAAMRAARAQALGLGGQTETALALLRANLEEMGRRLAAEKTPFAARDFVYAHTLIGETLDAAGRGEAACVADRETLRQYDGLRERKLLMPLDEAGNIRAVDARIARNCAPVSPR